MIAHSRQAIPPKLTHRLMRYPQPVADPPKYFKKIITSRVRIAIQIQQDIGVDSHKSVLQRMTLLLR